MENKEVKKELSRVCKVFFQDQTFEIKFPTNGQLIDIETMKVTLSNGLYRQLVSANNVPANIALDLVDSIATFSILIPALKTHLKVDNILDLSPIETKDMVKAYKTQYFPWYSEWIKVLQKDLELPQIVQEEKE